MKPIRILVVEDMETIRKMYDKVLPDAVFEKRFAANGKEGLEVYGVFQPEILLLDIQMPVLNGTELLKIIRSEIGDRDTTIIMQTSRTDKKDIVECAHFGIQGYIVKPFAPMEVGLKILEYYRTVNEAHAAQAMTFLGGQAQNQQEEEYLEEIRYCLQNGAITESQRRLLERLREKLGISQARAQELEQSLATDADAPSKEELEYMEELRVSAQDGVIADDARMLLERHRQKLRITEARAAELEAKVFSHS